MSIMLDEISKSHDDYDGAWLHPFQDNLLEIKGQIIEEFVGSGYWPEMSIEWDAQHLDYCRQLAGGC